MSIRIVTDSTCDLPAEVVAAHGITVVPCFINFDGRSLLDGVDITRQEFYERLPACVAPPTTSAPGIDAFARVYARLAAQGAGGIVSIHIAGSLSNVVNVAQLAARDFSGPPVSVIDAGQVSLGTGLIVLAAAQAAADGASLQDVVGRVETLIPRTHTFAALDTLEFLRRSGRVSRLQSGLGEWLQVKPLLKMYRGVASLERVRTRQKALARLVELARDLGPLGQLAFVHTAAPDRAHALAQLTTDLFPPGPARLVGEVTPVIGAHVGPGAAGLVCMTRA